VIFLIKSIFYKKRNEDMREADRQTYRDTVTEKKQEITDKVRER
jgi:hypothetical protein